MSEDKKEMSIIDHLEELRRHLVRAAAAVFVSSILAFTFIDYIFDEILMGPARADFWTYRMLCQLGEMFCVKEINIHLQNRTMGGQISMTFTASLITGLVISFPFIIWELWRFIKPALHPRERETAKSAVGVISGLFLLGVAFGYFVVCPMTVYFLVNYKLSPIVENVFDLTSYISTICMVVIGCGIMYQLPVIIYVLSRIGIVTAKLMRDYRRYAIVIIVIFAAIITPTQDGLTLFLFSLPIYLLYEISIFVSAKVEKNRINGVYNKD